MEKYYKLSEPLWDKTNYIVVSNKYYKERGGYVGYVEGMEKVNEEGTLWGKCFCKEYYEAGGDMYNLVVPCGRRSAKREAEAEKIIAEHSDEYVRKYLDNMGKTNITFELEK